MFGFDFTEMLLGIPGLIIAMTFHEYAHARAAVSLGDFTPRLMGRLTIDPRAHIDPLGILMLFLVRFGWAKPVMVNPRNFRQPKRDDIVVSLAGPAMNLLLGFIAFYIMLFIRAHQIDVSSITYGIIQMVFVYNVNFAIFNILPIPPLDGSHILRNLLPPDLAYRYQSIERYSILIMIVFIATPVLSVVLMPLFQLVYGVYKVLGSLLLF
ncbi:site-2 protease family protein [uncultured Selenomonas sp.]|uniref:site-2 protease family protein n=1 Tax=uncultured Selenomonas sp. TaxID=159275 RepID=UPI0028D6A52E|nr:site-2 protease family protein [uncultured Selenomonas sp.]